MVSPWQEDEILRDILDGLNAAIHEEGWDHTDVDPIKFNKLLFLAVNHFDLPVTYRWYKYGVDFTPHGRSIQDDIAPQALSDLASPEVPRVDPEDIENEDINPPSPEEVCGFYRTEVEDGERLFEDDTKEYLRRFYGDYAPSHLEEVYAACAVFQKSLDDVGHADDPWWVVVENVDVILDELDELTHCVMFCEAIGDVEGQFRKYANLLKDVLVTVAENEEGLTPRQEDALRSVVTFFYSRAWKLVALKIASAHTQGEQSMDWKTTAGNRFLREHEAYEGNLRAIMQRCKRTHLISDNLLDLTGPKARQATVDGRADQEEEVYRDWEGVSGPVSK